MKVAFTPEAEHDLTNIFFYLDEFNPFAAREIMVRIRSRAFSLADHPERGTIIGARGGESIRRVIEKDFLILYIRSEEQVSVLRILHGARDFSAILDLITKTD